MPAEQFRDEPSGFLQPRSGALILTIVTVRIFGLSCIDYFFVGIIFFLTSLDHFSLDEVYLHIVIGRQIFLSNNVL